MSKLNLTTPPQQLYAPPNLVDSYYEFFGGLVFSVAKANYQFGVS
jgi:hypothetical protein